MATGRVPTTANSPLTAKGDLFGYSTTQARVAVGNDGETLVADSSATTGLRWQGNFAAGKNALINADYRISQRGTSFSITSAAVSYTLDRWNAYQNGNGTMTVTQEAFTAGTAPVAGYEAPNFARVNIASVGTTTDWLFRQPIEDVRTFANQTVTLSFWAKASANQTIKAVVQQNFGSGGSGTVTTTAINSQILTASWVRYSATISIPSISGKTLGAGNYLQVQFNVGTGGIATGTIDFWGVQLEAGNTATAFQTATGTLAGELVACQRYYYRTVASVPYGRFTGAAFATSANRVQAVFQNPVRMRGNPGSVESTNKVGTYDGTTVTSAMTSITIDTSTQDMVTVNFDKTGAFTANRPYNILADNDSTAYIAFSAEL